MADGTWHLAPGTWQRMARRLRRDEGSEELRLETSDSRKSGGER